MFAFSLQLCGITGAMEVGLSGLWRAEERGFLNRPQNNVIFRYKRMMMMLVLIMMMIMESIFIHVSGVHEEVFARNLAVPASDR